MATVVGQWPVRRRRGRCRPSCLPACIRSVCRRRASAQSASRSNLARGRSTFACSPTGCSATPGRSGAAAASRSSSASTAVEPYKLALWRYGLQKEFVRNLGWYDDHGPRAAMQTRPTATSRDRRALGQRLRRASPAHHRAGAERAVLLSRQERDGRVLLVSAGRGARQAASGRSPCWPRPTPGTPTTPSAAAATTSSPPA